MLLLFLSAAVAVPGAAAASIATPRSTGVAGLVRTECSRGNGEFKSQLWDGFSIRIGPAISLEEAEVAPCEADIRDAAGRVVFHADDWVLKLHRLTGSDLNGDGKPEVVVESYAGGSHCCWTYSIVSLAEPAGLLTQVMNETPFDFRRSRDGHIEAWTRDGDFDYFESSHEYSPMPLVVLRFEGRKWVNVSGQYRDEYDHRIAKARRQLTPEMLRLLQQYKPTDALKPQFAVPKMLALKIVLEYLYSGREDLAWSELQRMWPPGDIARMKANILSVRAHGLLSRLRPVHAGPTTAESLPLPTSSAAPPRR